MTRLMHAAPVVRASSPDSDCRTGSTSRASFGSRRSPASSLCDKFDALEKKWSLYSKFGDLEKKWSQFSATAVRAPSRRPPQIIKIEDLERKWAQLHAFAKQETMLQQRKRAIQQEEETKQGEDHETQEERQGQPQRHQNIYEKLVELEEEGRDDMAPPDPVPHEEERRQDIPKDVICPINNRRRPRERDREGAPEDSTVMTSTETSMLTSDDALEYDVQEGWEEPQDSLLRGVWDEPYEEMNEDGDELVIEEEPEKEEKHGFMLKRRGAKRPRRLMALTKVRHWGLAPSRSNDVVDQEDKSDEEESAELVLFEGNSPKNNGEYSEDVSQRVLSSMPNHKLWQAYTNRSKARGANQKKRVHFFGTKQQSGDRGQTKPVIFTSLFRRAANVQIGVKTHHHNDSSGHVQDGEENRIKEGAGHVASERGEETDRTEAWVQEQLAFCLPNLTNVMLPWRARQNQGTSAPDVRDLLHERLRNISATIIQAWIRRKLAVLRLRGDASPSHAHDLKRRRDLLSPTVARVQSLRKFQVIERYRKHATIIQSVYRCWQQREQYKQTRVATIKIQRKCRAFLLQHRKASKAAARIQRCWLSHVRLQSKVSSQISFDGSGISTLSFDNSFFDDEEDLLLRNVPVQYPKANTMNPGNPVAVSPLPPLYPTSPLPRSKSVLRSRSSPHLETSPPLPPPPPQLPAPPPPSTQACLPPLPPLRPRVISPMRSTRRGATQAGLEVAKSRRRKASPLKGRSRSPSTSPERTSLRHHSPSRRRTPSPLANVVSTSSEVRANLERPKDQEQARPAPTSPRRHCRLQGLKKGSFLTRQQNKRAPRNRDTTEASSRRDKNTAPPSKGRGGQHENNTPLANPDLPWRLREGQSASVSIQKLWRGHRSQLELVSLLTTYSSVVCECTNSTVSRDRLLRQRAQVVSISKAIAQVDGLGADERLSLSRKEILAEWKNILYINFEMPNGSLISTFATVRAKSVLLRTKRIEALSREKVFKLSIKAALLQHLSEQQLKVSRGSLFARSLTRRRAPVAKDAAIQIQRQVRRRICRLRYLAMRQGALAIQKAVRSWQIRRAYLHLKYRALRIQAFFRGELVRGIVFQYWSAAIVLRRFWNHYRQSRLILADQEVSKIQALFRGIVARKEFLHRWTAAMLIQAQFRAFSNRRRFLAARLLCRNLRVLTRRRIAQRLQNQHFAAVFIQRWWRFEQYNNMMRGLCATIIATAYRCHRDSYRFHVVRGAAIAVQSAQRRKSACLQLCQRREASIEITRFFRDQLFRRKITRCLRAATLVASWYRGARQQRAYAKRRRRIYLWNLCATQIQSQFRRHSVQTKYQRYRGATTIQAQYRRFSAHFKFQQLLWSVAILQYQTRKLIEQRRGREEKAAARIQAVWRCWFDKSNYTYLTSCVTCIQSAFRSHRKQRQYQVMKEASITIQARWRSHCGRFNFHIHRGATIYLQRTWRHYCVVKEMRNALATRLVAFIRMVFARRAFKLWTESASTIQTSYRSARARSAFLRQRQSCVKLQAFWRQLRGEAYFCLLRILVVQSQAFCRRRIQRRKFVATRNRIILCQKQTRGFCQRKRLLLLREAVLLIQRQVRIRLCDKHMKSAVIQAEFRRRSTQFWYGRARSSALRIQRLWRMARARSKYLQMLEKARVIQTSVRWFFKRMRAFEEASAIRLQAWYRCHIARFKFVISHFSIVLTQSVWRSYQQRRQYSSTRRAVLYLQACFRAKMQERVRVLAKEQIGRFLVRLVDRKRGMALLAQKRKANKVEMVRTRRKERIKSSRDRESAAMLLQYTFRKHRKQLLVEAAKVIQRWRRRLLEARISRGNRIQQIRKRRKIRLEQDRAARCIQCHWRFRICRQRFLQKRNAGRLLVTRFQALLYAKTCRSQYIEAKCAAILIQSSWRRFCCRVSYRRLCERVAIVRERIIHWNMIKQQSAALLQGHWRRHDAQSKYHRLRSAVVVLQTVWRLNVIKIQSATLLQGHWRRRCCLASYKRRRHAAVVLQSLCRSRSALHSYSRFCHGFKILQRVARQKHKEQVAMLLQKWWRMLRMRKKYAQMYHSAVLLQSCWRMHMERLYFKICKVGSIKLQRLARRRQQHTRQVLAAILIQAQWRRECCRKGYAHQRSASIIIQRNLRTHQARRRYQQLRVRLSALQKLTWGVNWYTKATRLAIFLQAQLRMQSIKSRYHRQRAMVIRIQNHWRSRNCRSKFQAYRRKVKATKIQACWRRARCRNTYTQERQAAVLAQTQWRKYAAYRCYRRLLCATRTLQRSWRKKRRNTNAIVLQNWLHRVCSRQRFKKQRAAAVLILQKWTKDRFCQKQRCATLVQNTWRMSAARQSYCAVLSTLISVQATWRGKRKRVCYMKTRSVVILFQRKAKRCFIQRTAAAIKLQQSWRMSSTRASYKLLLRTMIMIRKRHDSVVTKRRAVVSALTLQRNWRAFYTAKQKRISSRIIQSTFRGFQSRRTLKRKVAAATSIQSWFRSSIARFKLLIKVICATIIQSVFRGHQQRRLCANARKSATIIARRWRQTYLKLRCYQASRSIQKFWRRSHALLSYRAHRRACLLLQRVVRQRHYLKLKLILFVQKFWRMHQAQQEYRDLKRYLFLSRRRTCKTRYMKWRSELVAQQKVTKQRHSSAVQIQKTWRGHHSWKTVHFKQLQAAALVVQSCWRGFKGKQDYTKILVGLIGLQTRWKVCFVGKVKAATCLQAFVRKVLGEFRFQEALIATVILQSHARRLVTQASYHEMYQSFVSVQIKWKGIYALKGKAAAFIQSYVRMVKQESKFKQMGSAAITIQSYWRAFKGQESYQKLLCMTIRLQARWKALFLIKVKAAIRLQSFARQILCSLWFHETQIAAVLLQSHIRKFLTQAQYERFYQGLVTTQLQWKQTYRMKNKSAVCIQCHARMARDMSKFNQMQWAIILLQSCWRRFARKQSYQRLQCGIVVLQGRWTAWFLLKTKAATQLQSFARQTLARRSFQEMVKAAVLLQAHIRRFTSQVQYLQYLKAVVGLQDKWKSVYRLKVKSATGIQSSVRLASDLSKFKQLQSAAVMVQKCWRSFGGRQTHQKLLCGLRELQARWKTRFSLKLSSAILLQSHARVMLCQSRLQCKESATTLLQACWRRFEAYQKYHTFLHGMVALKSKWQMKLLLKVASTTKLQSFARMIQCSSRFQLILSAVAVLQAHWRGQSFRCKQKKLLRGMALLQNTWRSHRLLKTLSVTQSQRYLRLGLSKFEIHKAWPQLRLSSALTIQKRWKMLIKQSRYLIMKRGFRVLQAQHRMRSCCMRYLKCMVGFAKLRARLQTLFVRKVKACTTIQAASRGYLMKLSIERKFNSAITLSSWFRGRSCRNRYLRMHTTIVLLQRQFRYRRYKPALAGGLSSLAAQRSSRTLALSTLVMVSAFNRDFDFSIDSQLHRTIKVLQQQEVRGLQETVTLAQTDEKLYQEGEDLESSSALPPTADFLSRNFIFEQGFTWVTEDRFLDIAGQGPTSTTPLSIETMDGKASDNTAPDGAHSIVSRESESPTSAITDECGSKVSDTSHNESVTQSLRAAETVEESESQVAATKEPRDKPRMEPIAQVEPPKVPAIVGPPGIQQQLQRLLRGTPPLATCEDSDAHERGFDSQSTVPLPYHTWHSASSNQRAQPLQTSAERYALKEHLQMDTSLREPNVSQGAPTKGNGALVLEGSCPTHLWVILEVGSGILSFSLFGLGGMVKLAKQLWKATHSRDCVEKPCGSDKDAQLFAATLESSSTRVFCRGLRVVFLLMAAAAAFTFSPAIVVSCVSLCLSMWVSPLETYGNSYHQKAARKIQATWRRHRAEMLFLRTKAKCTTLQKEIRRWQQQKKYKQMRCACVKLQQLFRSCRNSNSQNSTLISVERQQADTSMLRARVVLAVRMCFGCLALAKVSQTLEEQWICYCLFAAQVIGATSIVSQVCKTRAASKRLQVRAITTLQRAVRRRQALQKWKANLGIQKQEVSFCAKLQRFERLVHKLREQESDESSQESTKSPVSCFPQVLGDFLGEEHAACRIQSVWRKVKLCKTQAAAARIQSLYRGHWTRKRYHPGEIRYAAGTIRRYLLSRLVTRKQKVVVSDAMKHLLVHRLRVLSAVVIQRWSRTVAAKSKLQKLKRREEAFAAKLASRNGPIQEREAAEYVSRWHRLRRDTNHKMGSTFDEVINELCEDHPTGERPLVDQLLLDASSGESHWQSSSFSSSEAESGEVVSAESRDAESPRGSSCGDNEVFFQIEYVEGNAVKVTETDAGVELAVETDDLSTAVQCCGFEVLPSCGPSEEPI